MGYVPVSFKAYNDAVLRDTVSFVVEDVHKCPTIQRLSELYRQSQMEIRKQDICSICGEPRMISETLVHYH
jgi:hypothetical protein